MTTLTVEIPDQLMFQLNDTGDPVQEIVIKALEFYLDSEAANRRKKSQLKDTKTQRHQGTKTQRHKEKKIYPGD